MIGLGNGLAVRYTMPCENVKIHTFGFDAGTLINEMQYITKLHGVEMSVKVYFDGELLFDGNALEVQKLPKVQRLLVPNKTIKQIQMDNCNKQVVELQTGEKLAFAKCYKGDLLFENERWHGHKRPKALPLKWISPWTVCFEILEASDIYDFKSPTYWTVVEETELSQLCKMSYDCFHGFVSHAVYTSSLEKLMLQHGCCHFDVVNGRLVVTWAD